MRLRLRARVRLRARDEGKCCYNLTGLQAALPGKAWRGDVLSRLRLCCRFGFGLLLYYFFFHNHPYPQTGGRQQAGTQSYYYRMDGINGAFSLLPLLCMLKGRLRKPLHRTQIDHNSLSSTTFTSPLSHTDVLAETRIFFKDSAQPCSHVKRMTATMMAISWLLFV